MPTNDLFPGSRALPMHHLTIRVPWHDSGWNGTVCRSPAANTSCLVLPRISEGKQDDLEIGCAGRRIDQLTSQQLPPCISERATFMAPFSVELRKSHPYAASNPDKYGHFKETRFVQPAYSAACVPFRWMLRAQAEGNADRGIASLVEALDLGYQPEREPELGFETSWVQERSNQLVLLDTFFGAVKPKQSLCFLYAKRTPLTEDSRRVIVGVARVTSVAPAVEYQYDTKAPPLRCVLWERNVGHSLRPDEADGFLLPYHELLAHAEGEQFDVGDMVAFAPDEVFAEYSYGSELLGHDGAIASLLSCLASLQKMQTVLPGKCDAAIRWIDVELNRLWAARGPFPGLGSALSAFGLERGNLLAYEVASRIESGPDRERNPWGIVDEIIDAPESSAAAGKIIGASIRKTWRALKPQRRALLELLSRFAISAEHATTLFQPTERTKARIDASDDGLLSNPYLAFEQTRTMASPIPFATIDRGLFPDEVVRTRFPVPAPSALDDAFDARRVRAVVVEALDDAAQEGHTLLPRSWIVERVRNLPLRPACALSEDILGATEDTFADVLCSAELANGDGALQLVEFARTRDLIARTVKKRLTGARHPSAADWRALVDAGIDNELPGDRDERDVEDRARAEKAAALSELFASRFSVLVGPAGTGKTTLLRMLCAMPEVESGGVLLLAPTGKARVRLESETKRLGQGQTLAQFLYRLDRYDGATGRYFANAKAPKSSEHDTVIIDECSMLTEEQLGATLDALSGTKRLILVGDPRQLPPIGAGRPFFDIVEELAPPNVEATFPRVGPGYAELSITRRQQGGTRGDLLLAHWFSGRSPDPGADEIWNRIVRNEDANVRCVQWHDAADLQERVVEALVEELPQIRDPDDQQGFEQSIGGELHAGRCYFWNKFGDKPGAASLAEAWQILSPVRGGQPGVVALNRALQARFRQSTRAFATPEQFYHRKVPKPFGAEGILYGDKVINVVNKRRADVWPKPAGDPFVANGDIGIVVGQYKTKNLKGLPWKLEVEFATQLGHKYGYKPYEFGDEASPPLELAYALTVHKTQGSQFGTTFVVIPNPCWLLSRELLYTALTRQVDRIVLLHQGPIHDLKRLSQAAYSVVARRVTNLFRPPSPQEVLVDRKVQFFDRRHIHRTEGGELVRSKSELCIADKLRARGIEYVYEPRIVMSGGAERYPDFKITDDDSGVVYYWEHLGMLGDPDYRRRWDGKLAEYRDSGILPHEEGGGPNGTLLTTRDDPDGGLDAAKIAALIDEVFGR